MDTEAVSAFIRATKRANAPCCAPGCCDATEERARAFRGAFSILDRRISFFLTLLLSTLQTFSIQRELDRIGKQ